MEPWSGAPRPCLHAGGWSWPAPAGPPPLSSCLLPHISLASRLCFSPPRGRGGSRTSSGSFRERWARVPAQLQPLREEQGGAAGGHAQPASDTGAPACSGPLSLQAEAPLQCLPLSVFRQNQGPHPGLEWWDQHLSSSPAEPTEPLLPLEASSWSHLRLSGPHPLSADLWEVTTRRLQLITLLGNLSTSPWLIQDLPWTKRRKVRAVMGHPGDNPWDHLWGRHCQLWLVLGGVRETGGLVILVTRAACEGGYLSLYRLSQHWLTEWTVGVEGHDLITGRGLSSRGGSEQNDFFSPV